MSKIRQSDNVISLGDTLCIQTITLSISETLNLLKKLVQNDYRKIKFLTELPVLEIFIFSAFW